MKEPVTNQRGKNITEQLHKLSVITTSRKSMIANLQFTAKPI